MTRSELREFVLAAAVLAERITRSEAHYLKLYVANELGYVGEDDHVEAERIVDKIAGRTFMPKEQLK